MQRNEGETARTPPLRQIDVNDDQVASPERRQSYPGKEETSGSESTATHLSDSDEFDWSEDEQSQSNDGNEDLVRSKRGRRIWLAFMKLARPLRVFLIACLGVAILITPLIVVNVRFRESVVKEQVHAWSLWFSITWAAGCGTYLLVDMIPGLVIAITGLFGGQTQRLKIQVELVMAVKSWLKLVLDITWAWIALSVIRTVYSPYGQYWTIINRLMQAFFSAGIVVFVEKLFLQFVAINFHQKALADRLAENQLGLKALDYLSNVHPVVSKKPNYNKRGHRNMGSRTMTSFGTIDGTSGYPEVLAGSSTDNSPINENEKSPLGEQSRPRRKKRRIATVIVDHVGGVIGQVALKNSKFNRRNAYSGLHSARRLARKLFSALSNVHPSRSHLVVEGQWQDQTKIRSSLHSQFTDFYPYFHTTAEAHEAFALFDKDGNGDISKREMREAVQRIYRERKSLISGLKDVGSIVAKLDAVLLFVALIVIIFLCLLIFNRSNTLASLVPLATIVLGFSFVFGNSAKTLFESLIFIFSTHVFDVGDLVMIDDQVLFVKEFGLFSTTFRRVDGQEVIAPNSLLSSTKLVHNLRRSKSMWETTKLMVSYETPLEVIEQLRIKVLAYVNANNREWSDCSLNIDKMEFQNAIHLNVGMEHRANWQDWGGRWTRRTAFMRHLKSVLEELEIRYTMPIQPVLLPSTPTGPPIQPPSPSPGKPGLDTSMLGNAGFFQAGDYGRPSGALFK